MFSLTSTEEGQQQISSDARVLVDAAVVCVFVYIVHRVHTDSTYAQQQVTAVEQQQTLCAAATKSCFPNDLTLFFIFCFCVKS